MVQPAKDWRLIYPDGMDRPPGPMTIWRCRGAKGCRNPVVAILDRFQHRWQTGEKRIIPYRYCADHLYGRWIEDDMVMEWGLAEGVEA